ncbi:transcriptional regulator [Bacillus sp. UMB0899]|nr:transcriptional regulator [Bacillus sp. UMB0899]
MFVDNVSHKVELTSSEIANLWTQYINDSLSICFLTHSIEKAKDEDVKEILEFALGLAESHIATITETFKKENFPIPKGYSVKEDVNMNAPSLFTDTFMLSYMHVMTLLGLTGYAGAVATSSRPDQIKYFVQCNKEAMELYERIANVMLNKGLYSKPPRINTPNEVDFVDNQRYLTGWFGKKRPLSAVEISGLSFNMVKIIVKVVLEVGFGQVCQKEDVKKYFKRGKKLCEKQFNVLSQTLTNAGLASPASWVSEVTKSTVSPFSDKLMLNHIVILISAAIGYYGAAISVSQRRDLTLEYARLMAEVGLYAEDGAELLIKYGWLEEPPLAEDREKLANK